MYTVSLDLASRTVGIAISYNKDVYLFDSYISKVKGYLELQLDITEYIFRKINAFRIGRENEQFRLILEDVFVGPVNPIAVIDSARTSGGVIIKWYELFKTLPIIVTAIQARKSVGLAGSLSKVEYQIYVVDRFDFQGLKQETRNEVLRITNHWELEYKRLTNLKKTASKTLQAKLNQDLKDLSRNSKNALNRLSTAVKNETGIDEHKADAIIQSLYED
jgi:hypothetical protein